MGLWWIVWPSRAAEVGHDVGVPTRIAATPFHRLAMAGGPTNCHLLRMGRILGEMLAKGCSPKSPFSSSSRSALAESVMGLRVFHGDGVANRWDSCSNKWDILSDKVELMIKLQ
ncbi:hypothetical protein HNY73_021748 [Argiope bruennichi]|uniref:Uncharacterized protein n=1 Tax=Argiope bruennichi TaxID=94029 RepID=A0A8T0DZH2_ARGBR|nr:hypothetical protein HNY73_021748 [Argiope bruennichi]